MTSNASPFSLPSVLAGGQDLHIRGVRYRIRTAGNPDGRPLFLLHGLLDTGESFAPLTHFLDPDWHIIAPDWRGHGDTEFDPRGYWFPDYVADLEQIVSRYSGNTATPIISHSMGTGVATLFAGLRPEKVSALVCLDGLNVPHRKLEKVTARYRRWLDTEQESIPALTYADKASLAERVRRRYPELDEQHIRFLTGIWARAQGESVRMACDARHLLPMPTSYDVDAVMTIWREITAPILCIDGGLSPARDMLSREEERGRRKAFGDYRQIEIDDAGHFLHLQDPAGIAAHIEEFLRTTA